MVCVDNANLLRYWVWCIKRSGLYKFKDRNLFMNSDELKRLKKYKNQDGLILRVQYKKIVKLKKL